MSIADNVDDKSDAGFVRAYDARACRRRFQVSITLVLVLPLAAVALEMLTRLASPDWPREVFGGQVVQPSIAETLLDIRG